MVIAAATATPSINLTRSRMSLPPFCKLHMRRFTPESGQIADVSGCPLCANSDGTQRSKNLYSVTSSARASSVGGTSRGIRGTERYGILGLLAVSLRLDAGELDHLAPLLGFVCDHLGELSRRSRQRHAAEVSETDLHLAVVESRVDLLVELVDDLGRRGLRCADAEPTARLVARHKFVDGWDVRQRLRARRGCHRQCSHLAGPDVLDRPSRGDEVDLHLSANEVGERGCRTAIRHMHQLDAGHH